MDFQRFADLSTMLIEGMNASVSLAHESFTKDDFAKRVAETVLSELEKDDASAGKVWTEQQVPGLRLALKENTVSPEALLKLAAPGLIALSAESGEHIKNLAYYVTYHSFLSLVREKLK
jgi:hypothetical protein